MLRPEIADLSLSDSSFPVAVNAIMLTRLQLPSAASDGIAPVATEDPEPAPAAEAPLRSV